MDLSKLPRSSESKRPAPAHSPEMEQPRASTFAQEDTPYQPAPAGRWSGEAWLTLAVGIIILLMFPRFMQWASSAVLHTHFNEYIDTTDGITVIPYTHVHDFWPDLGCTLFGLVLFAEGLVMSLVRSRIILWIAFAFLILGTGYNLVYLIASYSQYGLALVSALAVAFGVYLMMVHAQLLRQKKWAPDVGKNVRGPG